MPRPIATHPAVARALRAEVERTHVALPLQTASLRELFELFTSRRSQLPRLNYLDDPRLRLAYLRYHVPLNIARATCVLEDLLRARPEIAEWERVVDLGAGPGSASLATLARLPSRPERSFHLTDRSRGALRLARELLEATARGMEIEPPRISTAAEKLPQVPALEPRSIVWLTMVLNELLASGRRGFDPLSLVRRLEARLSSPSVLIVIEPAQREPGRRLLELHDGLAASRSWRILAPCTHQKSCPLLRAANRPWCHFHFDWDPDPLARDIGRPLGLEEETGAFSYVVAEYAGRTREELDERAGPSAANGARVIGDAMWLAGGVPGNYVCRDGRRETLRDPNPRLCRGDTVVWRPTRGEKDRARLERTWPGFGPESRAERGEPPPKLGAEPDRERDDEASRGRFDATPASNARNRKRPPRREATRGPGEKKTKKRRDPKTDRRDRDSQSKKKKGDRRIERRRVDP